MGITWGWLGLQTLRPHSSSTELESAFWQESPGDSCTPVLALYHSIRWIRAILSPGSPFGLPVWLSLVLWAHVLKINPLLLENDLCDSLVPETQRTFSDSDHPLGLGHSHFSTTLHSTQRLREPYGVTAQDHSLPYSNMWASVLISLHKPCSTLFKWEPLGLWWAIW